VSVWKPVGHDVGAPTHFVPFHACPGQQQWPAVSGEISRPPGHAVTPGRGCAEAPRTTSTEIKASVRPAQRA